MERTALERELESRVESLGYELVELETLGSKARPLLRLRIDRPGSEPGKGVTIEDCTRVSRALEAYLDEQSDLGERYTLEVSSPGLERPLTRPADYDRFAGREIALKARTAIGEHGKRIEGVLLGLHDGQVRVELPDREVVTIPRDDVIRAHLIFRWENK
ncbi:MAG TPA: ribosome maturation factor RimP [Longimicrobiales bacterium]|nr:ribosome maturation factor RimP [Longimicrobiales bacterium]